MALSIITEQSIGFNYHFPNLFNYLEIENNITTNYRVIADRLVSASVVFVVCLVKKGSAALDPL